MKAALAGLPRPSQPNRPYLPELERAGIDAAIQNRMSRRIRIPDEIADWSLTSREDEIVLADRNQLRWTTLDFKTTSATLSLDAAISRLVSSKDHSLIVARTKDDRAILISDRDRNILSIIPGVTSGLPLWISPSGKRIALVGKDRVALYDRSGSMTAAIPLEPEDRSRISFLQSTIRGLEPRLISPPTVRFSDDGDLVFIQQATRIVAHSADGARILSVPIRSGALKPHFVLGPGNSLICFLPPDYLLEPGAGKTAIIEQWDLQTKSSVRKISIEITPEFGLFTQDQKTLFVVGRGGGASIDWASGKILEQQKSSPDAIQPGYEGALAKGENGPALVYWSSLDRTINVLDRASFSREFKLAPPAAGAMQVELRKDGRTLVATSRRELVEWRLNARTDVEQIPFAQSRKGEMASVTAWTPALDHFASATLDGEIGVTRLTDRKILQDRKGPRSLIDVLGISPSGRVVGAARKDAITIWRDGDTEAIRLRAPGADSTKHLYFADDHSLIVHADAKVFLYDIRTGGADPVVLTDACVESAVHHATGRLACMREDTQLEIFDLKTRRTTTKVKLLDRDRLYHVPFVQFARNSPRLLLATRDGDVVVVDSSNGEVLARQTLRWSRSPDMAFTLLQGSRFAKTSPEDIRALRDTLQREGTVEVREETVATSISDDGRAIALGLRGHGLRIFRPDAGDLKKVDLSVRGLPKTLSFSPNSERLAVATGLEQLVVVDLTTGPSEVALVNTKDRARDVIWPPQGRLLANTGSGGLKLLPIFATTRDFVSLLLERAGDPPNRYERDRLFLDAK